MPYSCSLCDSFSAADRNFYCHNCWLRNTLFTKLLLQYDIPRELFQRHAPPDLWDDLYRMYKGQFDFFSDFFRLNLVTYLNQI